MRFISSLSLLTLVAGVDAVVVVEEAGGGGRGGGGGGGGRGGGVLQSIDTFH